MKQIYILIFFWFILFLYQKKVVKTVSFHYGNNFEYLTKFAMSIGSG